MLALERRPHYDLYRFFIVAFMPEVLEFTSVRIIYKKSHTSKTFNGGYAIAKFFLYHLQKLLPVLLLIICGLIKASIAVSVSFCGLRSCAGLYFQTLPKLLLLEGRGVLTKGEAGEQNGFRKRQATRSFPHRNFVSVEVSKNSLCKIKRSTMDGIVLR